ncbi:MAG: serine hydrolase [Myxococcota bacterium]|jgi:CubicO group peptidase (beta-lactamase class C family)
MRALDRIALLPALVALSAVAQSSTCPSRPSWPTDGWPVKPVDATAKKNELERLESFAFTLLEPDSARKGIRTDGLVIIKNGAIIYERYGRGFTETNKHISWSVAKSVSSALIGVAVKQGALRLDDSICEYLRGYSGQAVCGITVKHALTFATGLAWQEEYEDKGYQVSSVISMLFGVGHRDQLRHILTHRQATRPGEQWLYSTGDAELASAVAKGALERKVGKGAFWKLLFDKLGMKATLEEDVLGTPLGGSMVYATPRDFAKFGWLFINDGCWDGERLLPEGWVKDSTTISEAFEKYATADEKTPSGYAWWLNQPAHGNPKPWPDAPDDTYAALGHWGQRIIVIPSEDIVIVRTGDDREGSVDVNELLKYALPVAR